MTTGKALGTTGGVLITIIVLMLSITVGRELYVDFLGTEIARSKAPNYDGYIAVRRFGNYKPRYLCRYYSSGQLISAQSHYARGKSASPAQTATITWGKSGGAVVCLDNTPVLEMSGLGFWTEIEMK